MFFFLFIMFLFRIFLNEFYIKLVKLYGPILAIGIMLLSYIKKNVIFGKLLEFLKTWNFFEIFQICLISRNQKN